MTEIRIDDLSGADTRALVERHLAGMHEASPPESVHALDVDALRRPGVTFWSAHVGNQIAACGALAILDASRGEIKSMRVADAFLGRGVGRAMLCTRVSARLTLERGSRCAELFAGGGRHVGECER